MRRAAKPVCCGACRHAAARRAAAGCGRPPRSITGCRCSGCGANAATRRGRRCWITGDCRTCRRSTATPMRPNAPTRRATAAPRALQPDLAQIDAGAERGLERPGAAAGENLHGVAAGILVELVEFEIAVIVGGGHRHRHAVLDQLDAGAFDAVDDAVLVL